MSKDVDTTRRHLLATALPAAAFACLGCRGLAAESTGEGFGMKAGESAAMTTEETYTFFYGMFIPLLESLAQEIGREPFLALLTQTVRDGSVQLVQSMSQGMQIRDAKTFSELMQQVLATPPLNEAFTYEVVEESDTAVAFRFSSCLPAKLLRAMNAEDIGYAIECSGSEAGAKAFNPRMRVSNPQNLMRGDPYCIERFSIEP